MAAMYRRSAISVLNQEVRMKNGRKMYCTTPRSSRTGKKELKWMSNAYSHSTDCSGLRVTPL